MSKEPEGSPNPSTLNETANATPWKVRVSVSTLMLLLALLGLLILGIRSSVYWPFICIMSGIDAILCIGLMWYSKTLPGNPFVASLWHMILQWLGYFGMLYLIALLIQQNAITAPNAGLLALMVLAFTIFIAGVYSDTTLIVVGIALALMATAALLLKAYLWLVMVPVIIVMGLIIYLMIARDRRQALGS